MNNDSKVLVGVLAAALAVGVGHHVARGTVKHQGPCTVMVNNDGRLWFQRPNGELYSMYFDNPPAFSVGVKFSDLAYTDDSADMKHFVSATLATPSK